MQRGAPVARVDAVARYREGSRAAMERLRAHAITHRRGFTLDVEIGPTPACSRWIRLIAEPLCEGAAVVGLRGLKCLLAGLGGDVEIGRASWRDRGVQYG